MADDRDETRQFSPFDDDETGAPPREPGGSPDPGRPRGAGGSPDPGRPSGEGDISDPGRPLGGGGSLDPGRPRGAGGSPDPGRPVGGGGSSGPGRPLGAGGLSAGGDGPADETRIVPSDADSSLGETRIVPPVAGAPLDETRIAGQRPDATAYLPPATDDWASSRANPAWAGRAEVRERQPGDYEETEWRAEGPADREPRGRWWMPILIGTIALVLLAVLGYGIYQIAQNTSDDDQPATSPTPVPSATTALPTPSASPAPSLSTATTPSKSPTTAPATTAPTVTAATTNPALDQTTIPALKGYPLPQAQAALVKTGLKYRMLYRTSAATPGTVIDSDPAEGQQVPADTTVTLVVAVQTLPVIPSAPITVRPGGD
jgi:hypothetical protein